MRLKSLSIKNFRNLKELSLEFPEDTNYFAFIGKNGHGKTNLLEAIFITAISKSFRTKKLEQGVLFDQNFCSLKSTFKTKSHQKDLEFVLLKSPLKKGLKVNGVSKKAFDYIGHLNVVFFSPDDMSLIYSSPANRRRYLNLFISQFDRSYLELLTEYQQVLKQRNALLKLTKESCRLSSQLSFWDQKCAELGVEITKKRIDLVERISDMTSQFYYEVSDESDKLKIRLLSSIKALDVNEYLEKLNQEKDRDIETGFTQFGPHRDDLLFLCNGKNMASYASRGEWRSLILTLKFTEIELLKEKTKEWPIFLLDDVFSELDEVRQNYLFNKLKGVQTFITTTHADFLEIIKSDKILYEVNEGIFNKIKP